MTEALCGELEEPPMLATTRSISSYRLPDGTMDLEALAIDAEGGWRPAPALTEVSGRYIQLVTDFLHRRMEEANIWEATGCLPDNRPYNRQAWWRLELWLVYLDAKAKEAAKDAES